MRTLLSTLDTEGDAVFARARLRLAEVIVVDDGSVDRTAELVESYPGLYGRLRLIRLARNSGKGAAVRAGVLAAAGSYALVTDADMSTPLDELVPLAAELERGSDLAMGSRALPASRVLVHQPWHRETMGKAFNLLLRLATALPWRDTQCGFKLFRLASTRVLFERQRIAGFAYDAELCVNARRLGLAVAEVPVRWIDNRDTRVRLVRSSLQMAFDLVRIARLARKPPAAP